MSAFGWTVLCAAALAPAPVVAAPAEAADVTRLQGEVERLKQELADQRQLILQLMQSEQQRYDVVLRFLRAGGAAGGGDVSALPPPPSPSTMSMSPKSGAGGGDSGKESGGGSGREAATVSGRVRTSSGQIGEAYVYVDGLRSSARGHTVE
ncbi:MAG TPA: hypothetical protein VIF57_09120, partial [Polyangia bacterium]